MMHRAKLVRVLAAAWLAAYTGLVYAFTAFSQEMRGYDYESLGWAFAVGLAGGMAQTILWLANREAVVVYFWRQLTRDVAFALVGGGVVYVLFNALAAAWPQVFIKELRFAAIFLAGFSRGRWRDALGAGAGWAMIRARSIVTGQTPRPLEPAAIPSPADAGKEAT